MRGVMTLTQPVCVKPPSPLAPFYGEDVATYFAATSYVEWNQCEINPLFKIRLCPSQVLLSRLPGSLAGSVDSFPQHMKDLRKLVQHGPVQ